MGVTLTCSHWLHLGFFFAASGFVLRYKQYPATSLPGCEELTLAFQARVTL
jgi:hypothetical protein